MDAYFKLFPQRMAPQPLTEKESEIEKQVLKEFECPVCLTYATPPIYMCPRSHIICAQCWHKCAICPTCRGPKSSARALALEKLYPILSFPCKFAGCSFRANGPFTQEHELTCKYFPIKCPLSEACDCKWHGPTGHARGHLIQQHISNVYFDPGVRLVTTGFRNSKRRNYSLIFYCYERIFRFNWEYDCSLSPVASFSMVQIGNRNPHESYQYTVAFSRSFPINAGHKRAFVMQSGIPNDVEDDYDQEQPKVIQWGISFNHLTTFCTKPNGDLYYEVIIRRHYGPIKEHEVLSLEKYESLVDD